MKAQKLRFLDSILSGVLLIAVVLGIVVFFIGALFSVSMSGSWLPLLFYSFPFLLFSGAIYFRIRRAQVQEKDPILNTFSWRREALNATLIVLGIVAAWILHVQSTRHQGALEQSRTEQDAPEQPLPSALFR